MDITKMITKMIGDKRRYRQYKARTSGLPDNYREATEAIERYLFIFGPGEGDAIQAMLDDLADLFELSATSSTPIRVVVGDDPVEFVDAFLRNYPEGGWITRERQRLVTAIDRAVGESGAGTAR